MIELRNVYKRYHNHHGSEWVLRDINLIIPQGVSVGLIGRNGAGKSTLLRLIAGMDSPDRGEVIRHSRVSWPVGLSGGMQSNMTGRQNVKFVARTQGRGGRVTEIIDFVEDFADIGDAFDEPVKTYSSGMRSRISFGLSLAFDFDVYISDEATAVGDRIFKDKAKKLFKSKVGKSSLIMVSHAEGILRDLCHSGIYLTNGSAIWFENIDEAIATYHEDVDERKNYHSETTVTSNKANFKLQQEALKIERKKFRAIANLVQEAQLQEWVKKDMLILKNLQQKQKQKVEELIRIIDNTKEGYQKKLKERALAFTDSYSVATALLKEKNIDTLEKKETEVIHKAKTMAYQNKLDYEKLLSEFEDE